MAISKGKMTVEKYKEEVWEPPSEALKASVPGRGSERFWGTGRQTTGCTPCSTSPQAALLHLCSPWMLPPALQLGRINSTLPIQHVNPIWCWGHCILTCQLWESKMWSFCWNDMWEQLPLICIWTMKQAKTKTQPLVGFAICTAFHETRWKVHLLSFMQTSGTGSFTHWSGDLGWHPTASWLPWNHNGGGTCTNVLRDSDVTLCPQPQAGGCPGLRGTKEWNRSGWVDRKDLGLSLWYQKYHAHYAKQLRARNSPKSHHVAYRGCSHFLYALWINRGFQSSLQEP